MKKLLSFLLATIMIFSLAACGKETTDSADRGNTEKTESVSKNDVVDTSKLSVEELSQIALDNANAYLKEKYPDATFEYSGITPDEEYDSVTKEMKKNRFSFNEKTFEENGIHKKTYRVNYYAANGDPISVVTDVSLKNKSGKNSCYDNYQLKKIMYEIFLKLENILEPNKTYYDNKKFEVDNYDRYNLNYFKTYFDESKGILEFLKTAPEFKDKNSYVLNHFNEDSEEKLSKVTFTGDDKTFLSYFTDIYTYSFVNKYEFPINSLTFDYQRMLGEGSDFYTVFAPYLNGIDKIYKYDANDGKFVEQTHKLVEEKNTVPTLSYIATGGNTTNYGALTGGNLSEHLTAISNEYTNAKDIRLISDFYTSKEGYHYFISLKYLPTEPNQQTTLVVVKDGQYKFCTLPEEPKFFQSNKIDYDKVYVSPNDVSDGSLFFVIKLKR